MDKNLIPDKEWQKLLDTGKEHITSTKTDEFAPILDILMWDRTTGEFGRGVVGFSEMPENKREVLEMVGAKIAHDHPGKYPVAVSFISEAWRTPQAMSEGALKAMLESETKVNQLTNKQEVILLAALKIDGTGVVVNYPITRKGDIIVPGKPETYDVAKGDTNLLQSFYEGYASAVLPEA
jgi:hypothetical protein